MDDRVGGELAHDEPQDVDLVVQVVLHQVPRHELARRSHVPHVGRPRCAMLPWSQINHRTPPVVDMVTGHGGVWAMDGQ